MKKITREELIPDYLMLDKFLAFLDPKGELYIKLKAEQYALLKYIKNQELGVAE